MPNGTLASAWNLYLCGIQEDGRSFPPLFKVCPLDFDGKSQKKEFSKYKDCMMKLVVLAQEEDVLFSWKIVGHYRVVG